MLLMNRLRSAIRKGYYNSVDLDGEIFRVKLNKALGPDLFGDLIGSERMVIDKSVMNAVAVIMVQKPNDILSMLPFIKLPYDRVWIEYDSNFIMRKIELHDDDKDIVQEAKEEEIKPFYIGFMLKKIPNSNKISITEIAGNDDHINPKGDIKRIISSYSLIFDPDKIKDAWNPKTTAIFDNFFSQLRKRLIENVKEGENLDDIEDVKKNPGTLKGFLTKILDGFVQMQVKRGADEKEIFDDYMILLNHLTPTMNIYDLQKNIAVKIFEYLFQDGENKFNEDFLIIQTIVSDLFDYPRMIFTVIPILIFVSMTGYIDVEWEPRGSNHVEGNLTEKEYMHHLLVRTDLSAFDLVKQFSECSIENGEITRTIPSLA